MAKISINSKIKGALSDEVITSVSAIKNNNTITFNDNGTMVKIIFLESSINIIRENKDLRLSLLFEEGKNLESEYLIKELNSSMKVTTITKKLLLSEKKISIEYDLYINDEYSDNFIYHLEWSWEKWI